MTAKLEVERKRKITSDKGAIIDKLTDTGFGLSGELNEVDTYYSRPDIDFMKTVECLRIRERDGFAEVTYKPASTKNTRSNDGIVIKPETDLPIDVTDVPVAKRLLLSLDMVELVEVSKYRQIFLSPKWPNVTVALDTIKGAGLFIEVEVMGENQAAAIEMINNVEEVLQLTDNPIITKPYRDICMGL